MLDLQRQRFASRSNPGTVFTRAVVLAHLAAGLLAAILLLFHERFLMALVAALWFLVTVGLVAGMMNHLQWCRIWLAILFGVAAASCVVYLIWVVPALTPDYDPVLSLKIMPFWLSVWSMVYGVGSGLLLVSKRIERATMRGFELWPLPPR